MKLITFDGKGKLVLGHCTLASGESDKISDKAAAELVEANPGLPVTITDLPAKSGRKRRGKRGGERRAAGAKSQPEAHEGEGQPPASTGQEE